jgi:hypothetical protein
MESYFGETLHIALQFVAYRKGQFELWKDVGIGFHIETYFRSYILYL